MSTIDKSHLRRMMNDTDAADNTEYIRDFKNSERILSDVRTIEKLRRQHSDMDKAEFTELCQREASFLYNGFTIIFNKLVANEINLATLSRLIHVLQNIENGYLNQYDGSVQVGELLREIYINSAVLRGNKIDEENPTPEPVIPQNISWREYKILK
jgi:hypothetical protein